MSKVSVIIPVYNTHADLLSKCINSVFEQSHSDLEIFIIDDGSTKNCLDLLKKLEQDSKINLIRKSNEGVSTARNIGIQKATGEWIMFVDADDYIEHNLITELLREADENTDIICSACKFERNSQTLENHFYSEKKSFRNTEEKKELYKQLMYGRYSQNPHNYVTAIGVPWAKLYRKAFLDQHHLLFDTELKRMQDNIFNMHAFFYANKIIYLNKCLYNYNCEHLSKHINKYYPDYTDKMLKLVQARTQTVNELGLISDPELKEYYLYEQLRFLGMILVKSTLNRENKISFIKRFREIKILCRNPAFNPLWIEKNTGFIYLHGKKAAFFYKILKLFS